MTRRRDQSGFALLLVFAMAGAIAIMLYSQMPRAAFEAQRDKEGLLIERGEQYVRAIQLFFAKTKKWPQSIDELEKFAGTRFLRQRYKDPMTGKDDWKLLKVNAAGQIENSAIKPLKDEKKEEAVISAVSEAAPIGMQAAATPGAGANLALRRRPSEMGPDPNAMPSANAEPPPAEPPADPPPDPRSVPALPQQVDNDEIPEQFRQPQFQQNLQNQQGQQQQAGAVPTQQPGAQPVYPNGVPGFPGAPQGQLQPGPQPGQQQPQPGQPYPVIQQFPGQQPQQPNQQVQAPAPGQGYAGPTGYGGPNQAPNQQLGQLPPAGTQYPIQGQPYPTGGQPYQQPGLQYPQQGRGQQQFPTPMPMNQPQQPPRPPQPPPPSGRAGFPQPGQPGQPQPGQPQPGQPGSNAAIDMIKGILMNPRQPGQMPGAPGGPAVGAGIVGVASTLEAESIKLYNERQKYNEWEFVYDMKKDKRLMGPGQQPGVPGAQPGQPIGGNQPGQPLGGQQPQQPTTGLPGPTTGGSPFGQQQPPQQRPGQPNQFPGNQPPRQPNTNPAPAPGQAYPAPGNAYPAPGRR